MKKNLNDLYYSRYGVTVEGTCGAVASVGTAEYYNRKGYVKIPNYSYKGCFLVMMNCAIDNGAWKKKTGIYESKIKNMITDYYKKYKKSCVGSYYTKTGKNVINNFINNSKPVVGSFYVETVTGENGGHAMTICGYLDVTVKYKNSKYAFYNSKTIRYYIVNNGWEDCESGDKRIQYIDSKYLSSVTTIS